MYIILDIYRGGAPFLEVLQYQVDAWSGRSKPLFHLPVPKINLIYGPRVGDVSDIKLIRTDTTLDLSQKAEKRYRISVGGKGASHCTVAVPQGVKAEVTTYQDILHYASRKAGQIIQFQGKDILISFENKNNDLSFFVELILVLGKFHIHKKRRVDSKPNVEFFFYQELKQYGTRIRGLKARVGSV